MTGKVDGRRARGRQRLPHTKELVKCQWKSSDELIQLAENRQISHDLTVNVIV